MTDTQASKLPRGFVEQLSRMVGAAGLLVDEDAIAPFLTEPRGTYQGRAEVVVRPGSTAELAEVVRACAAAGVAMVPQGGGTGLCGGAVPSAAGDQVVISLSRLNRIRSIDPQSFTMTVEAGCILADLQQAAESVGLLFPLSLGAEGSCQIGGNLSTNAGGTQVIRYGNSRDLVLGLEVVLPDGQVLDMLRGLWNIPGLREQVDHTLELVNLTGRPDTPVSELAYGEKRRLEVGLALAAGRVRTQLVASQIYKRDSMMGQAMEIGALEVIGLRWQDIEHMLERLKAVTAAEVQSVARKYFSDDTLTIATLDPQSLASPSAAEASAAAPAAQH